MNFLGEKEVTVNFLGEKEVTMKFFGKKEVTVKFSREKEVTVNFPGENKVMVKPLGGKEAILINEVPCPPPALINIAAIDSRAMLNTKKAERTSPSARVRKVWIPKQYLT